MPDPQGLHRLGDRSRPQVERRRTGRGRVFSRRPGAFVGAEEAVTFADDDGATSRVDVPAAAFSARLGRQARRARRRRRQGRRDSTARAKCRCLPPTPSGAGSTMSRCMPDGAVAWSAGKTAFVQQPKGEAQRSTFPPPSAASHLRQRAFALAVAHYNGVTMWFPNMAASKPEFMEWKGSHLGVTFSPDGRFMVTSMHESRCTAGGSPTSSTCGCPAIRAACARCHGPRAARGWPPRAPTA